MPVTRRGVPYRPYQEFVAWAIQSTMVTRSGSSHHGAEAVARAHGAPGAVAIAAAITVGLVVGAGGLMVVLRCRERGNKAVTGGYSVNKYANVHNTYGSSVVVYRNVRPAPSARYCRLHLGALEIRQSDANCAYTPCLLVALRASVWNPMYAAVSSFIYFYL